MAAAGIALLAGGCAEGSFLAQLLKRGTGSAEHVAASGPYVVGAPYQVAGTWYYPREQFDYDATGTAVVTRAAARRTATGEAFDPDALTAAHDTLQLPAVARVTNLENGRQALVRINDRGPHAPGRILGVTPAVARLLGFGRAGAAQVRVQVLEGESRRLAAELTAGPALDIAAAPRGTVEAEALAPPPGAPPAAPARGPSSPTTPARAGTLYIQAGVFADPANAGRVRTRLARWNARTVPGTLDGRPVWKVRVGPFADQPDAEATLARMLASGLAEGRIVVD